MNTAFRFLNARTALLRAREACPHWDYESDPSAAHECCLALDAAMLEARKAKKAAAKS